MTLVKRATKGSALTGNEYDANLDHTLAMENMVEAADAKVLTAAERAAIETIGVAPSALYGDAMKRDSAFSVTASSTSVTLNNLTRLPRVGEHIVIYGAGVAGANLETTIATVTSITAVTVNDAASTTVSLASGLIATDETESFETALASYKSVFVPDGSYYFHNTMNFPANALEHRLVGSGWGSCFIIGRDGQDIIAATGEWARLELSNFHISHYGVTGARTGGIGVKVAGSVGTFACLLNALWLDTADSALDLQGTLFSSMIRRIYFSSDNDHGVRISAGKTTSIEDCYALFIRAANKCGYRMYSGGIMRNCNGVNSGAAWGIFGSKNVSTPEVTFDTTLNAIMSENDGVDAYAQVSLEACNVEDFSSYGIVIKSPLSYCLIKDVSFMAPATGTFQAYIAHISIISADALPTIINMTKLSKGAAQALADIFGMGSSSFQPMVLAGPNLTESVGAVTYSTVPRFRTASHRYGQLSNYIAFLQSDELLMKAKTVNISPSASGIMAHWDGTTIDKGVGKGLYFDDASNEWHPVITHKLAKTTAITADGAVTALQCDGRRVTNAGAAGIVTVALPAATRGRHLFLERAASQTFRADPNGTEIIGEGGAGKYLELGSDNAGVELFCHVAGSWSVRTSIGTVTYEP